MTRETTFFSYSRSDSVFALKLAKDLREAGANLWLDQLDIKPGSRWDASIEEALNASASMIVILSPSSIASNNVMDEVSFALENGKKVIPVLWQKCTLTFRLKRFQYIDFTGDYETGFRHLLGILAHSVSKNNYINIKEPETIQLIEQLKTEKKEKELETKPWTTLLKKEVKLIKKQVKPDFKKKYFLIGTITLLLVFLIWTIIKSISGNPDIKAWNLALQKNDSISFANYKKRFPNGAYYGMAQEKLDSLSHLTFKGRTIKEFKGHSSLINSVAFSPDGKTILTGSGDNTARLWALNGNTIQEFKGHRDIVSSVAFSPDGKTILTASWDKTACLWDLNGNILHVFKGHSDHISSVAFSPDGKTILTSSEDKITRLWDLNGNILHVFKSHPDYVNSVAFSPDGKTILITSWNNTPCLWDLNGNILHVFKGHSELVGSVAFSPDGKTILTGSIDSTARLWDLKGNILQVFKNNSGSVVSVAFSPNGKTILTGSFDNKARLWDLKGNILQVFKGHSDYIMSVAFSPDGKKILTGSIDKTARLWE